MRGSMDRYQAALAKLDSWIEHTGFKGWDPHDALNSPLIKRLTFNNRLLGIAWVQLFKRSPLNLRPLLGVAKGYNPKGMGLFLASYLLKHRATGAPSALEQARFFATWLKEHRSPGYHGACWGYNFDWPNRGFFAPAGTPTVINTAFIALAFLNDCDRSPSAEGEALAHAGALIHDSLEMARSACDFILHDLNILRSNDELCFSYTPLDRRCIHNANLMAAQLLAEVSRYTHESHLAEHALAAARFVVRRQQPDGAWRYGINSNDHWIDNFHTGYVLVALKRVAACLKTTEFDTAIDQGYRFWKERMFLRDGTPKYYHDKCYPIDAHCVAQAVLTFLAYADHDRDALERAHQVALWGIEHMQDNAGFFHYQIYPRYRIRIPYVRWTQAWMQRALTELVWGQQDSQPRSVAEVAAPTVSPGRHYANR